MLLHYLSFALAKNTIRTITGLGTISLAFSMPLFAETPRTEAEQKGYDISARSDRSDRGFADSTVNLQMLLRNAAGDTSVRDLTIRTLEIPDEQLGDRSLIIFKKPADIKGTALLSHAKILDADDQWLYLPALKRTKRISSVNKSGPFVGSEFAFEDLTALELNKYTYKFLRSEACGDMQCDVVERIPQYEHSGYSKQITWIDQSVYQVRKVEYYDRRGDLLKTLNFTDYRQYGNWWRAHDMTMENHLTNKSTTLAYGTYEFNNQFTENDFVKGILRRVR